MSYPTTLPEDRWAGEDGPHRAVVPDHAVAPPGRMRRFARGRPDDPVWVRPVLLGLLMSTGILYIWGLGASGWANSFYTAAVQAGTKSWKALFFGSFDSSSFITVDKSPGALWVMEISARIFGFNSWSVLVPQALEGVATVGLVYLTVRRWFTPAAGLLAGAVAALTPAAVLIFRFNNPDALMVMLLTLAAYATVRAVDEGRVRWSTLAGAAVGFAFLAKMLEAFLILPALALVVVVAGSGNLWTRLRHLLYGGAALAVSAGWWVMAVQLTPAADRPYIGGSQDNSLWNLMFGYNGFGRLSGNETGSVGGGPTGTAGRWGATGLTRLFGSEMGTQASWLLPAALLLLIVGLVVTRRAVRTNRTRAGLLLWGGWLIVAGLAFSLGQGIIHPYYTVALAPAIGGLVGSGASLMWANRERAVARATLAGSVAVTGVWASMLLHRTPSWLPWLRPVVIAAALVAAAGILLWPYLEADLRAWRTLAGGLAFAATLAGPLAYAIDTAHTAHTGAIPSAGPAAASTGAGPGAFGGPFGRRAGNGRFPGGQFAGGQLPGGQLGGGQFPGGGRPSGAAGGGGLLNAGHPNSALVTLLKNGASGYKWVAAIVGANEAAGYQLSTGDAVMAIGGFNGTDPYPTLAQFQKLVQEGRVHYFIAGAGSFRGGFAGPGGFNQAGTGTSSASSTITNWVQDHYSATTVGGVTIYDLTAVGGR